MSKLFIVATPIGNLKDITLRALDVLREADLILCEDTRTTKKLLERYQISKPILSYHQHSRLAKIDYILNQLQKGKNLALVSEAGTPGISDPGNKLIEGVVEKLGEAVEIIPIPGPSALISALSISGFSADKFLFLGFPPSKKRRKKFFQEAINSKYTVIFYESPHRIIKALNELTVIARPKTEAIPRYSTGLLRSAHNDNRQIVVCRELTKKFETIYRGDIEKVIHQIQADKIKGEFVVIIDKEAKPPTSLWEA